jgi:acetyl esterase/lipase
VRQAIVIGAHDERFRDFGRSYATKARAAGESQLTVVDAPASGHFDVIAPTTATWSIVQKTLRELFAPLP